MVDTVGAGDTFTGSMMVALLDENKTEFGELSDDTWRDVLDFAAAAAAFNCTRDGANPPTSSRVREVYGHPVDTAQRETKSTKNLIFSRAALVPYS